jgi:aminopeptidase N
MKPIITIVFCLIGIVGYSQQTDLIMSKEIKKAYNNGTRSFTGAPGENYFINQIDYDIKADFNPETRILKGEEIITYTNNSNDTLDAVYFNIYQDIYKKGNSRDWDIGSVDLTDGVEIHKIIFEGTTVDINSNDVRNSSSILRVKTPNVIQPKSSVQIEVHWSLIIPGTVPIRMGTYGDKNYFIAYWFPKIAVYDDIMGWNRFGHSGNQEFYNDFGNYNVEIIVPGNYNVWSTGVLKNSEELYQNEYLKRIQKSLTSDEIINIISKSDREKADILKKAKYHTWKFESEATPDFAFAVSKTYLWDATSLQTGNRRISINAVYKPDSKDFHEVAEISKNSVKFFSEEIPGVPYPYPQLTAFNGDGGMEFPGMVNDGDAEDRNSTLYVTSHEIGHSYFPFYTGLNEQKYAWMDEGLITFFPQFVIQKYTDDKDYTFFKHNIESYNYYAGTTFDVPLMIDSYNVGRYAYRFHAYARSAVSFYLLYQYLGKEKFTAGLKLFIERWKHKHPTPYDFFFTMDEIAGENLSWFWKPWFFEIAYADLSIKETYKTEVNKRIVIIENLTGFPVPVELTAEYKNGDIKIFHSEMNVWANGEKTYKMNIQDEGLIKIQLNTETIPDAYPKNNTMKL